MLRSKMWAAVIGVLVFVLGMGDTVVTYLILTVIPDSIELNPVLNYIAATHGREVAFLYFPVVIFIVAGFAFYRYWYAPWSGMRLIRIAVYSFLVIKVLAITVNLWQFYVVLSS